MPEYLNQSCWHGRISDFLRTSQNTWLKKMTQNHNRVNPYPLSLENLRAWKNSFDVLQNTLRELGPEYQKLHLIFEYCLPKNLPQEGETAYYIWTDAIIVSENTAVVLEFKDRPDAIIQHARQAKMYRNRLQKYHDSSVGMRKWAIWVPTLSSGLQQRMMSRVTAASPDMLASVLTLQFGTSPSQHHDISQWMDSTYSHH